MSTTSLLRDADIAMYEAKRAGKGQIRIFDPAMRLVATKHLEYRSDLGEALDAASCGSCTCRSSTSAVGRGRAAPRHSCAGTTRSTATSRQRVRADRRAHRSHRADRLLGDRAGARAGIGLAAGPGLFVQLQRVGGAGPPARLRRTRRCRCVEQYHVEPQTVMVEMAETVLVDEGDRADRDRSPSSARRAFRFAIDDFGAGLLLVELSPTPPGRPAQDRSQRRSTSSGSDPRGQHAGPHDLADGRLARHAHGRRGHRDHRASSASCGASAAISARATCCRARSRPTRPRRRRVRRAYARIGRALRSRRRDSTAADVASTVRRDVCGSGMVCPYSLSIPGGVQAQVLGLARELRRQGHEVRVLGPCDGPPPELVRHAARRQPADGRQRVDRAARARPGGRAAHDPRAATTSSSTCSTCTSR